MTQKTQNTQKKKIVCPYCGEKDTEYAVGDIRGNAIGNERYCPNCCAYFEPKYIPAIKAEIKKDKCHGCDAVYGGSLRFCSTLCPRGHKTPSKQAKKEAAKHRG